MKLTKSVVDKIKLPTKGQTFYRDTLLTGFAVRVTVNGAKSFVVEKRIGGRVRRTTIGRYPAVTVERARKIAQQRLGDIAYGKDPSKQQQGQPVQAPTLKQAFEDYLQSRKALKPYTIRDYHRALTQVVPDWLHMPITDITKEMIIQRHTQHGETRSQARANLAMRILRAIFNYAISRYDNSDGSKVISENPVARLSQTRAWYKIQRRDTVIKKHELHTWHQGLEKLVKQCPDPRYITLKDYLMLVLLTGLRRGEAASLTWPQVDFVDQTLTITDTKNSKKHTLPLSDFLYGLLKQRQQMLMIQQPACPFIFPAETQSGYIQNFRKWLLKASKLSGINFTVHDLRRTFITIAESLDISVYALKRLLNHTTANDVTAGYIILDVERLREPMQKITDHILALMQIDKTQCYKEM